MKALHGESFFPSSCNMVDCMVLHLHVDLYLDECVSVILRLSRLVSLVRTRGYRHQLEERETTACLVTPRRSVLCCERSKGKSIYRCNGQTCSTGFQQVQYNVRTAQLEFSGVMTMCSAGSKQPCKRRLVCVGKSGTSRPAFLLAKATRGMCEPPQRGRRT